MIGTQQIPGRQFIGGEEAELLGKRTTLIAARLDFAAHPTDTKWDESEHPRDDSGRFGSGSGGKKPSEKPWEETNDPVKERNNVREVLKSHMVNALKGGDKLSSKVSRDYKKSLDIAFQGFTTGAMKHVMANVSQVKMMSHKKLNDVLGADGDLLSFAGFYAHGNAKMAIAIENYPSGIADYSMIISHEAAHAIDRGREISNKPEWKKIFKDEFSRSLGMGRGGINEYSRTNPQEAFAVAMSYTTNAYDFKTLKKKCPKACKYLLENNLIVAWES